MTAVDVRGCDSDCSKTVSIERAWQRALEDVTAVDGEEMMTSVAPD